jgi:hypothetical protein
MPRKTKQDTINNKEDSQDGGKKGGRKTARNRLRKVQDKNQQKKLKSVTPKDTTDKEQFYCVSCKKNVRKNRAEKNITIKQAKNGRWMMRSSCGSCQTKLTRFISNEKAEAWAGKRE